MISAITQAHLGQAEKSKSTDSTCASHDAGYSFSGCEEAYSKKKSE